MVLFPVMIDFCVNNIENDRYSIFYFIFISFNLMAMLSINKRLSKKHAAFTVQ